MPMLAALLLAHLPGLQGQITRFNVSAFAPGNPASDAEAQAAYLQLLAAEGYDRFFEGFEGAAWDTARSTIVGGTHIAASIESQGITWRSSEGDFITTSDANSGVSPWHIYSKGGSPQEQFHAVPATIIGESSTMLYGMGFWVSGGPPGKGKLNLILNDTTVLKFQAVTGFDDNDPPEPLKETSRLTSAKQFYGVVVPEGFNKFQLLELDGVIEDQVLMWAADFTFAVDMNDPRAAVVPEPRGLAFTAVALLGFGFWRFTRRK